MYHSGFSSSLVCVALSAACSLESFFILGGLGGPLSTIGLHCMVVCDNAARVACVDPFIVPYTAFLQLDAFIVNGDMFNRIESQMYNDIRI